VTPLLLQHAKTFAAATLAKFHQKALPNKKNKRIPKSSIFKRLVIPIKPLKINEKEQEQGQDIKNHRKHITRISRNK
jgi:hypothetical protein